MYCSAPSPLQQHQQFQVFPLLLVYLLLSKGCTSVVAFLEASMGPIPPAHINFWCAAVHAVHVTFYMLNVTCCPAKYSGRSRRHGMVRVARAHTVLGPGAWKSASRRPLSGVLL